MHVVLDACVIAASYWAAWFLKFKTPLFRHEAGLAFADYMQILLFLVPGYLVLYYGCSLYTPKRVQGRRLEFANIIKANTIGMLIIFLVLYMYRQVDYSRTMLLLFYVINIAAEVLMRNVIRYILRDIRRHGFNQKHILLVGYSRAAEEYIDRIRQNPQWGYTVREF